MNNLLKALTGKNILIAIGLLVLIVLILYLSSIFRITWLIRIGILVFILLIFIIIVLYKKMKNAEKAGQIEQSISDQSGTDVQSLSADKRAEIEQFKKQLDAAITALKNSKLGRGKLGRSALYKLPWYMIIGPPAAGKTTAIQNSGLEFPFGKDGIRGVGGTRNCDWFFSTKGVFLDTAGRYVTQLEDRAEWMAFLETLRKNRRRKPINGVIVALNIDEIINSDNEQLYEHAKNIRGRIDELIENLRTVFPVYFVFTKCDLIQGFVENFGDFSEIERSQIWGATLNAQQQLDPNPKNVFELEFKILSDVIFKFRTIRLSNPLKREQRRKVFLFPFQFKSLRKKLTYLIGEVFQQNPYQDNPIFRGFYFTSGTQEGVPLDLAIGEIAKQFNLPAIPGEEFEEVVETKNYFIKDLLNDIVIPDQNYSVGQTSGVVRRYKKLKFTTISVSTVLLFILSLFTIIGYNGSNSTLEKISVASSDFNNINWRGDLLNNFSEAENFRNIIQNIETGEVNESSISFGMDRSEDLLVYLKDLYLEKTEDFFSQNIFQEIVKVLNNYSVGQGYSGGQIYRYLKSYLLMGNERAKLDTTGQKLLASVFTEILNNSRIINSIASSSRKDSLNHLFKNYILFVVQQLKDENVYPRPSDDILVNSVRSRIQNKPSAESIYARLIENGNAEFPNNLTLEKVLEGQYIQVISTDLEIPFIFTTNGWNDYVREKIIEESLNPGREDWVLGKAQITQPRLSAFDTEKIKVELFIHYSSDYIQHWVQFIQSIEFSGFKNVLYATSKLKKLGDPVNSPLIILLKKFADELKILADSIEIAPFTSLNSSNRNLLDIDRYRKFVLGEEDGSTEADLNVIISQYGILSGTIEPISGELDKTKEFAVSVLDESSVEFPTSLQTIKGALSNTKEFENLLIKPVILSWNAIIYDATKYLNLRWKSEIDDYYNRTIANSYPFLEDGSDVTIEDFSYFFNPDDGILWSFFYEELSAFIKKDRWEVIEWNNKGVYISPQFRNALIKADEISKALFKGGDLNVSFRLKPQLPQSRLTGNKKPFVEKVYVNFHGYEESYEMGTRIWSDEYSWPANSGEPGASLYISLRDYGTSIKKDFEGDWALFKLLDDADGSRGTSSSQFIFNWTFKKNNKYDVTVSYFLKATSSRNPFSENFFKSFSLPNKIN
ncbi:MAG: type VI secretion system membrane subunit TssM [Bacteroidetes bacterium]|nr:type VI secretion system membrane subunit TssM [Bacteroidota bacterium]